MTCRTQALPDFGKGEDPISFPNVQFEPIGISGRESAGWQGLGGSAKHPAAVSLGNAFDESVELTDKFIERPPVPETILMEEHKAAIEDLTGHFEDLLTDAKKLGLADIARVLEQSHIDIVKQVGDHLESELSRVLADLVSDRLTQANVNGLIDELKLIVKRDAIEKFTLTGPAHLTKLVAEAIPQLSFEIEVEEADSVDLVASINDHVISTSIENWSLKLKELTNHAG